jgi:hypothetical protein
MTALGGPRRFSGENHHCLAWLLALVPALLAVQSAVAQIPARLDPLRSATRLSDSVSKNPLSAAGESNSDSAQCQVHVVANEVIVSDHEREEVGYHVQPPGIIPEPGQWPYFAWSDTSLGGDSSPRWIELSLLWQRWRLPRKLRTNQPKTAERSSFSDSC